MTKVTMGGGFHADVYTSKLDNNLTTLLASTFLGGSDWDEGRSITLDDSGNVYITGFTRSSDFPTTPGAYDESYNGGVSYGDSYISKLNGNLNTLLASSFLGGNDSDRGFAITLDADGNVYATGYTESSDFPTTPGGYDESHNGDRDVYISKLDGNLSANITSINDKEQSTEFMLYANYPNPFNPSTNIKFNLPKFENVKIEVFNLSGQKIKTLINKPMPAGSHEVEFTAKNLPSGVYLYRIKASEFQQVKKMILLR